MKKTMKSFLFVCAVVLSLLAIFAFVFEGAEEPVGGLRLNNDVRSVA